MRKLEQMWIVGIMGGSLLACTFFTPAETTPTAPPPADDATNTPLPTNAFTATLRPTVTAMATFTPAGSGIATPIPLQSSNSSGGGGSSSVQANSSSGAQSSNSAPSGGVAPVGVRENVPGSGGSSGSFSAPANPEGGRAGATATSPGVPSGSSGSFSVSVPQDAGGGATATQNSTSIPVVINTAAPLTPTVPPRAFETYSYTVASGRSLVVLYDIEVLRGTVILWAVSPSGDVVWQQAFTETVDDEAEITVPESGEYRIYSYVEQFSGSYQVGYASR